MLVELVELVVVATALHLGIVAASAAVLVAAETFLDAAVVVHN